MNALRLPIHLRQTLANDRGLGVEDVSLLVEIDGLGGVFRFAGVLILLLVNMAHGVVEVGVGTRGGSRGSGGGTALLCWGRRFGWRRRRRLALHSVGA